ncbi:MAG: electron transfer flavoprotein subunit alpha/FixB family protein [Victivallaceae bacterium]
MKPLPVWILAESRDGHISRPTYELIYRARALADSVGAGVGALCAGSGFSDEALDSIRRRGVDLTVAIDDPNLKDFIPELHAAALAAAIRKFDIQILLAAATATGRTLLPYLAMQLKTGLTADCTELALDPQSGLLNQTRPAIGGNIMATIQCRTARPQMATVRPHSSPAAPEISGFTGEIVRIAAGKLPPTTLKLDQFLAAAGEDDLAAAERVVVIGRGVRKAEQLEMIREFARLLGASIGGTREVVDRGLLSYPHQIGLSGKTIAPKLYIGLGLSGAIQHLAGMRTSEKIIAVNREAEAPIFKVADIGIVGDLQAIVPQWIAALKKGGKSWI